MSNVTKICSSRSTIADIPAKYINYCSVVFELLWEHTQTHTQTQTNMAKTIPYFVASLRHRVNIVDIDTVHTQTYTHTGATERIMICILRSQKHREIGRLHLIDLGLLIKGPL